MTRPHPGWMGVSVVLFAAAVGQAQEPVKIGLAAMISPKETLKYYGKLMDYVGRKIGQPVEMVQKPTYDDMDVALERKELDVAFLCAGPYVKDKDKFGVELLVAPVSHGQAFYHAYIIVPKSSPAQALKDLQGKKFAFTDPKSNTGCLVPRYLVAKQFGKTADQFFGETSFSGSHDKSVESVAKKLVDGASVDSLIYDYMAQANPRFTSQTRIVEKSVPYGIPPVVVNRGIDARLRARLQAAFLGMHTDPEGKAILDAIKVDKFIVPQDKDYDSVREMEKALKTLK